MMTTKGEWVEFTRSKDQIAELKNARLGNGFIFKYKYKQGIIEYSQIYTILWDSMLKTISSQYITHYWIIPDDSLREMKIRQAMTGQPVWYKHKYIKATGECGTFHHPFIQPETYEYSFTAFEE